MGTHAHSDWVLGTVAMRRLQCSKEALANVCALNGIRRLVRPGAHTRYNASDIDAVMASAIIGDRPATPARAGA